MKMYVAPFIFNHLGAYFQSRLDFLDMRPSRVSIITSLMPREPRIEIGGRLYDVITRENNRRLILNSDDAYLRNQGGELRAYKYDSLGGWLFERIPEQSATINDGTGTMWSCQYTYTNFSTVQTKKDPRGVVTTYGYDTLNRLTSVAYNIASAPGVEPTTNVSMNDKNPAGQSAGKGQVDFITDGAGRDDFTYDTLGRLTSKMRTIDGVNQYTTGYEYNQASQLSVIVYPTSRRVRMNHDSRGRLSGVEKVDTAGGVLTSYLTSVGYNAAGQATSAALGNGVTESFTYDAQRLQLTREQATKGATTLMDLNYSYQAQVGQNGAGTTGGNSGQLMKIAPGSTINGQARDQSFTYDNVGRLVTATGTGSGLGAWQRRYGYDRWGNRTGVWNAVSGGTQLQTVSIAVSGGAPTNRINTVTEGGAVASYSYDAAGNVTNDGRHTYQYDAENRIVSVDKSGATILATYAYDGGNRRVKKATGGVTTYYIWEGAQAIAEYSTAGASGGGGLKYYLSDRLSTRMITDGSGTVLGTQDHLPFGEDAGIVGQSEKHRFTTYERDGETDSDYAINRQYSQSTGRFLRPDPISGSVVDPPSLNRYAYVAGDPVNFVDPLGEVWEQVVCTPVISEGKFFYFRGTLIKSCTYRELTFRPLKHDEKGTHSATKAGTQGYTRPNKADCAKAMEELRSKVKEWVDKFVYAIMYGQDEGHHKKMTELKGGITNSIAEVVARCFDKDGGPRFPDVTGGEAEQMLLRDARDIASGSLEIPPVGHKGMPFTSMKIGAAFVGIGKALATAGKTVWGLVFAH